VKADVSPPRGTRDLLPDEVERRDAACAVILDTYRAYGFRRIETPAIENLALLMSGEGGENEKLIFKILKRGEKLESSLGGSVRELADLGLRFDLTVPLARYYAHNHARLPTPFKAIQIGPVWRAERPQRGRYRQFTQCDIDVLGLRAEVVEIELILATCDALVALGVMSPSVRLNDRRLLTGLAQHCGVAAGQRESFFIAFDKLDKVGVAGVVEELRAAGHPGETLQRFQALLGELEGGGWDLDAFQARIPPGADGDAMREAAAGLRTILDVVAAATGRRDAIRFDPTLVRGMGYYTGPIFEVARAGGGSSLAGGGRYDRMIGKLLGRDVPACGFSIGLDRLVDALPDAAGTRAPSGIRRIGLLFDPSADPVGDVVVRARDLRHRGDVVSIERKSRNMGRRLAELESQGFTHYGVAGSDTLTPLHPPRVTR
jgi:histidyl-tRNA synthetase